MTWNQEAHMCAGIIFSHFLPGELGNHHLGCAEKLTLPIVACLLLLKTGVFVVIAKTWGPGAF